MLCIDHCITYQRGKGVFQIKLICKTCTRCANDLPATEEYFYKDVRGKYGLVSRCRDCEKRRKAEYRKRNPHVDYEYVKANKESLREYKQSWYLSNKERVLEMRRKRYRENKEEHKYRQQRWYEENKDQVRDYKREWKSKNRLRTRLNEQRREARKKELPDTLTLEQKERILQVFNGSCALSGIKETIQFDHVIPLNIGHGGTTEQNIIPLAATLNSSKYDNNLFTWFDRNKERFNLKDEKFNRLIEYLADVNEMTVVEYRSYVYWCHDNPITVKEEVLQ